jgi:PAP2 superfamily
MSAVTAEQWVCPACRHGNPMDADGCDGCGATFASLLREAGSPALSRQRAQGIATGVREIGVIVGLFVLWKVASAVSVTDTAGAFARGQWIWNLERTLRLPSELSVQGAVLGHPGVVQLLNVFYLAAHIGSIVIFLPWLFLRHRAQYRQWRNIIAVFTGVSLLIQLVSVAPPRLLPQFGFVDTAALYHQSAYSHLGPGMVDQLSSMPSIHVGWAIAIAVAVISVSTSRWRWLVIAHPVLTAYAVVATANHFWLDGAAAALLVGLVMIGSARLRALALRKAAA